MSLSRETTSLDPMTLVDLELRQHLIEILIKTSGFKLHSGTLSACRIQAAGMVTPFLATPPVEIRWIPGPEGAPDLRLYIVNGNHSKEPRPAILYMHGGGFVAGQARDDIAKLQGLSLENECVIVSVDYRLSPETQFPGPMEDNYAALKWIYSHCDEFGIDTTRIAVMGSSAGGGHAALLSITARDRGEVPILFQILDSPMLDDRTGIINYIPDHLGTYIWKADFNRFGWDSFLGAPAASESIPDCSVPARVSNLEGLPPTFIGVGSIDLLVSESIRFAQRLIEAGVSTELHIVPGAYHGFEMFAPDAALSKQYRAIRNAALSRAFARLADKA